MIKSMTGFASTEKEIKPFGKIGIELRSSNHKFLEVLLHLPEGFLSLEEKIKKEIEAKIKRGRITAALHIVGSNATGIFVNKHLLKEYITALKNIKEQFNIQDEVSLDTIISLPGILSLEQDRVAGPGIWSEIKLLVKEAAFNLLKARQKEGEALYNFLKKSAEELSSNLKIIKIRFKKAIKERLSGLGTDEERASFLKDNDITEELERLAFHIRNFKTKIKKSEPIGKELDFIAQEMQREANTMAAKLFDASISSRVVGMKSQIEKIREQVQNVE